MDYIDTQWLRDIHQRMLAADLEQERETGLRIAFSAGDRVRVVFVGDNLGIKQGWRGTVLDHAYAPWVALDKHTHQGDPANPFGIDGWMPGHMACFTQDQLELIPSE
jgi:hypothetical protein